MCNHLEDRTDPLGYCVEVFEPDALRRLEREALTPEETEHVTLGFKRRGLYGSFHILAERLTGMRWTVDREEDFLYLTRLFEAVGRDVSAETAVRWCRVHPHPGDLTAEGAYQHPPECGPSTRPRG